MARQAAGGATSGQAGRALPRGTGRGIAVGMDLPVSATVPNEGPLPAYRALLERGVLHADPAQARAAEVLQDLWRRTRGYDPHPEEPEAGGFFARFMRRK